MKEQSLFNFVLKHSTLILEKIELQNQSFFFREQFVFFANFLSYFIINKKIKKTEQLGEIFEKILSIVSKFKQYLLGEQLELKVDEDGPMEGISQMESYLVETPHPIERGKTIKFKNIVIPRAFGFLVEFDKNCQDEENTDQLVFHSWQN